jgi:glycerol-3-phosphate O-acyltransferase
MIERPGWVLRWVFARFFQEITFPAALGDRLRRASDEGQLVYVFRSLSAIEYLFFTFTFLRLGLPLARFANGLYTLFFAPIGQLLDGLFSKRREEPGLALRRVVGEGGAAALFLKRPQTLASSDPPGFRGPYVEELIRLQRARSADDPPILLAPLVLLWGTPAVRTLTSHRGLVDRVFGGAEDPGRLRTIVQFVLTYRDSQVLGAELVNLRDFLAEAGEGQSDEVLARKLRWRLSGALESEVRVVLGPPRKGSRRIRQEVLRSRKVVREAAEVAHAEGLSPAEVERRARRALAEIAAEPMAWVFFFLKRIVGWILHRIFDGLEVDEAGLEGVRQAAHRGPIILVPSHKSHIDYLVLSSLFAENDLVPPHIAAGANLSFFPLGFLFRRAGAFFLRRSFKGDRLYGVVFRGYVRRLLREGYSVEFFIEGGRSRTGKLLAPKLGLLGMIVEAALEDDGGRARHAQLVPVSIGYEKVIEDKSYAQELAGAQKRKETVTGLLKATRVLWGEYGRLNIQFGPPRELGPTLQELGAMAAWDEAADVVVPADEESRRRATERLAHLLVYDINRITAITPTSLTASVLLGASRRGIERRDLLDGARFLLARVRAHGGRISSTLVDGAGELDVEALDRALDLLARDGDLEVRALTGTRPGGGHSDDEVYVLPESRRGRVAYYRNNALHLFVDESLVSLALVGALPEGGAASLSLDELSQRTLRLSRMLKREFTYRVGAGFDSILRETVGGLVGAGLLAQTRIPGGEERLTCVDWTHLRLLAGQVADFAEGYLVVVRVVERLQLGALVGDKELLARVGELGERLFLTGAIERREACVSSVYKTAVDWLVAEGRLVVERPPERGGGSKERRYRVAPSDLAETSEGLLELLGRGGRGAPAPQAAQDLAS